jgi:3',5'-cyclic AMP phosphodiesterase CpdA
VLPTSTTFLHLSELHLVPPGRLVEGVDPMRQLRSVLARIERLEAAPAFIVVSGDLTDDGSAGGYEVVNEVLTELGGGGTPVLLALGNHDDRVTFRRVVLGDERADALEPYCYSRLIDGLRVIVLDSTIPGEAGGAVGAAQLAWLESELQLPAPRGNLIVLHHPCRLAGPVHHYPQFIVREAAALEALVARHQDRIVGVLAGHSHQANSAPFGGTLHATAPAVLVQLDFFAGEEYRPVPGAGFNLCQLDDGGLIVSPVLLG